MDDLTMSTATRRYWIRFLYRRGNFGGHHIYAGLLNLIGGMDMARGKASKNGTQAGSTKNWTEFVEIPMGGTSLEAVREYFGDDGSVSDSLAGLLESGYRFGFSFNDTNSASVCSVTCKDPDSVNSGMTFTAFAADWYTALQVALYKHFVIAGQNWRSVSRVSDAGRFG